MAALLLLVVHFPGDSTGEDAVRHVTLEVQNISYLGGDDYKIELVLTNTSASSIAVREFHGRFHVQTEVLGQWTELRSRSGDNPWGEGLIQPGGTEEIITVVEIPLYSPRLFVNAFGEVNIRFTSSVSLTAADERGGVIEFTKESYYWITPETDKWTLREGM